jgi:hypothetical protein
MPIVRNIDSFTELTDHMYDQFATGGYDYERHILQNVVSPELFGNPLNDTNYRQIERCYEYLINAVRQIKLTFAFAFDKHSKLIN